MSNRHGLDNRYGAFLFDSYDDEIRYDDRMARKSENIRFILNRPYVV